MAPGATLTIEPGVEVRFDGHYSFFVEGILDAIGNPGSKISFTSNMTPPSPGDWESIQINSSGRAVIKYCDITYGGYKTNNTILLQGSNNNILDNINISNFSRSIYLISSNSNIISNCTLLGSNIILKDSSNNTIENNAVSQGVSYGINLFEDSSYNIIQDNNISNGGSGGINIKESTHNTLINNKMWNNLMSNLLVDGVKKEHFNHTIDTSNDVNGIPLLYLYDLHDTIVENLNLTHISLVASDNVTLRNITIYHGDYIYLSLTYDSIIQECEVDHGNSAGIYLFRYNENNLIKNSNSHSNYLTGVGIIGGSLGSQNRSQNNTVLNVSCWDNIEGIHINNAQGNYVSDVEVFNNSEGIRLCGSPDTFIRNADVHHNDFGIEPFYNSNNTVIMNSEISDNTQFGLYMRDSYDNIFVNTTISGNQIGVNSHFDSRNNVLVNSTISSSGLNDIKLSTNSDLTTLNTTFDDAKINVDSSSELTVKNYLDVLVLNKISVPITGVDLNVTDNGNPVHQTVGFGGCDPQTDGLGYVRLIEVTDRMYIGGNVATENFTTATISYPSKTFVDNPRDVNMSASHTEIFLEVGGVRLPDLVLATGDISFKPSNPVEDGSSVFINTTIRNIGFANASNILVRFFDGSPALGDQIGSDQTIPFIQRFGGSGHAEVQWMATPVGTHDIYVVVDPDDTILESNESNNVACKTLDITGILPPRLYIESFGDDIVLNWTQPRTTEVSHYLIYRSTSQTGFNFNKIWVNTSSDNESGESDPIPQRTTWNDTGAASDIAPQEYYYTIITVSKSGKTSPTSRTLGKWTKIFPQGISTFSLPLEPLKTRMVDYYLTNMNATYIKWMNRTTHTWVRHVRGSSENITLIEVGEGYEIGFNEQTRYTFCGMPGAMIIYDDESGFLGFDPDSEAKNLTIAVEPDGDVTLTWQEPASMGFGDWYEVYFSNMRDGFFGIPGVHYDSACPPLGFGNNTVTISGLGARDPGARLYFMVVPFNASGVRSSSTYSIGIWTEEYLDQYDTFGIPLKLNYSQIADWYCDAIPNTVGINYYNVSTQRWCWHSTRMPAGAFDPVLMMSEGYQISTSNFSKFTFIGV